MENNGHTGPDEALEQILREIRQPEQTEEYAPPESGDDRAEARQTPGPKRRPGRERTGTKTARKDAGETPAAAAEAGENTAAEAGENAAAEGKKGKPKNGVLADAAALLLRLGWIAFIMAILLLVVCGITVNSGERMAPAFQDRDIVVFYRLAKDIRAGEVVVFRGQNDRILVGRVVAKAGDTVDIDEKGLKINGYYQDEPYRRGDTVLFEGGASFPLKLRAGEFFILCDDRSEGSDSRTFGPVSSDRVLGRVMLSIRQRDF